MEGRGIATVVLGTDEFRPLAAIQSRAHGLPDLPVVTVGHPIGGIVESLVADKAGQIVESVAAVHPEGFRDKPLDALAPIARDWRDIMVIVVGGAGKHSAVIPTFGMTRSVTRLIAS